jgi:predicted nucleic acid-binding protein
LNRLVLKSTPTANLMEEALLLASEKNLTAYDACYAVLAEQLDIPLITADESLLLAIKQAVFIGDFVITPIQKNKIL